MRPLHSRTIRLDPFSFDIRAWSAAAASVALVAACLIALSTATRKPPAAVGSGSGGSIADAYVALRDRVEGTLPAVRVTRDAEEILGRGAAVEGAIRSARPHAARGELFTPAVAESVRALITADMRRRSASDRTSLMREVPATTPHVNERYPASQALATFPSLLLEVLPRLPDDLEYRFMGRDLIIWDARTSLIVDYLPNVIGAAAVTP